MSTPRRFATHIVLSGRLYVMGGRNTSVNRLRSVEYYEPSTNKWQPVASMRYEKTRASACVLNGFIYVLGGAGEPESLQAIERYDPDGNSWTEVHYISY